MARPEITGKRIRRWFSKRQLADRYSVATRTVDRWVAAGKFPAGIQWPNKRWYWSDIQVEDHERSLVGGRPLPESEPAQASTAA
jgi:hypothetical protein